MSLNLRMNSDVESLNKAVNKVKGKIIISVDKNLFNCTGLVDLYFAINTRNNNKDTAKKNTL
jgi:hypothetical protein